MGQLSVPFYWSVCINLNDEADKCLTGAIYMLLLAVTWPNRTAWELGKCMLPGTGGHSADWLVNPGSIKACRVKILSNYSGCFNLQSALHGLNRSKALQSVSCLRVGIEFPSLSSMLDLQSKSASTPLVGPSFANERVERR